MQLTKSIFADSAKRSKDVFEMNSSCMRRYVADLN